MKKGGGLKDFGIIEKSPAKTRLLPTDIKIFSATN
jgi:hypothetical protein